ncbi:hypothetical protein AWB69_06481 [Caballeronia udeis]|uniref:Uncharacterized protein n=1 Tax=Caballeronia udeis TaxID=1232866 RepID=A0A158IPW5_9BURK|nr:hypothetical protein [Caballeronia udeis]SAL58712.1 hypothetical protein AWB69_06481 [Caballeronia udeis]
METVVSTSHQGYRRIASACPARCGLHTADLATEQPEGPLKAFIALDYFFDRAPAWTYATRSGRI